MAENFFMKSFVMDDGERYCLLVDKASGIPLYYPNLFVATQVRNASLSYSSMEASLGGISVLLKFMIERNDNLESRFQQRRFFEVHELDALRDYCQIKFNSRTISEDKNGVFTLAELREGDETVRSSTEYVRLTVISNYVQWLGDRIMASVLANVPVHGLEAVLIAVEQVLASGAPSAEHILNVLTRLKPPKIPAQVATSLMLLEEPLANTARYDRLNTTKEINHA